MVDSLSYNKVSERFKWGKSIFITVLLILNIALKEFFRYLEVNDSVVIGCFLVFVVAILIFVHALNVCPPKFQKAFLFALLFYLILACSSFTNNPDYGLQKASLGLLVPFGIATFLNGRKITHQHIVYGYAFCAIFISLIAIAYKVPRGLFNRSVNYGVLGPIPFGWVNGMAFLALALKPDRKFRDALLVIFFFLMVIWSFSKGPLVALSLISLFKFNTVIGKKISTKIFVIALMIVGGIALYAFSSSIRSIRTIVELLNDPDEYAAGAGKGSIGVRENYLQNSLLMFEDSPVYGVGFGNWSSNSYMVQHKYPHNVVAELLAEVGIIGLILFLILINRVRANHYIMYVGYFGLLSLLFSGDFSYLRYAIFPMLTIMFIIPPKQRALNNNL